MSHKITKTIGLLLVIAGTSLLAVQSRTVKPLSMSEQLRLEASWNQDMENMVCAAGEEGTGDYFRGRVDVLNEVADELDGQ